MEEPDIQSVSQSLTPRPVAITSRVERVPKVSSTQSRPSNTSLAPKLKGDGGARPPSAGISAWEGDAPQPGAELLQYLGKTDSSDSGTSTPRQQAGTVTGDGNLTQALLMGRKAAEARDSSGGGGDPALARGASFHSQSSGGGGNGGGGGRPPSRLFRGSGSLSVDADAAAPQAAGGGVVPKLAIAGLASAAVASETVEALRRGERRQQQQQLLPSPRSVTQTPRTEAEAETTQAGGEPEEAGAQVALPSGPSGMAGDGGGDGSDDSGGDGDREEGADEAERLRGLLYSDDEGGNDEEYQDLMTADDEALFGIAADPGSGVGSVAGRGGKGKGKGEAGGVDDDREGGDSDLARGVSSRSIAHQASGFASESGTARLSDGDGELAADVPTGARSSSSSNATASTCGGAGADGSAVEYGGATAASPTDAAAGAACTGLLTPVLPSSRDASLPAFPALAATGAKLDAVSFPAPAARMSGSTVRVVGGATEALEKVLSGRLPVRGIPGLRPAAQDATAAASDSAAASGAAAGPMGQWQSSGPLNPVVPHSLQQQPLSQPSGSVHFPQYQPYPHPHYSIPTPQIGEGLRQHPPQARRLYTPGQTNRSPVRGSGYVVSPAAVRPGSPSASPSRGAYSAVHHHQHQQHPPQDHQSTIRRLSSPAVSLGFFPNGFRPRSPAGGDQPHAAAPASGGGLRLSSEGGDGAAAGPQLAGGVLRPSCWMSFAASGAAAGGAGGGGHGGLAHSGVSRFPPALVQTYPGGQVYRSTPISQVTGSPSDELAAALVTAVAAARGGEGLAAGSCGAGNGLGQGASARSPGRLSSRGGRSSARASVTPPSGGGGGSGSPVAPSTLFCGIDRLGSSSAPARPSTSPNRFRLSAGGSGRASVPAGAGSAAAAAPTGPVAPGGALSAAAATAIFGNGILSVTSTGDAAADAPMATMAVTTPRAVGVPALPSYSSAQGIRHCGFKPATPFGVAASGAAATVGGGGAFGSPFSTARQVAAAAGGGTDDRLRSTALAARFPFGGSLVSRDSFSSSQLQQQHEFAVVQVPIPLQTPRSGTADGAASADGTQPSGAAAAELRGLQLLQQHLNPPPAQPSMVVRKHSLPHLLAAAVSQPEPHAPSGSAPAHNHQPAAGGPGLHAHASPARSLTLQGRGAGRLSGGYDGGLPAVQGPLASGSRSFGIDMSRRAMSRA